MLYNGRACSVRLFLNIYYNMTSKATPCPCRILFLNLYLSKPHVNLLSLDYQNAYVFWSAQAHLIEITYWLVEKEARKKEKVVTRLIQPVQHVFSALHSVWVSRFPMVYNNAPDECLIENSSRSQQSLILHVW